MRTYLPYVRKGSSRTGRAAGTPAKRARIVGVLVVAAALAVPAAASARNGVANGGFERPDAGPDFITFYAGERFPGWRVVKGSINIHGPRWDAARGIQSLDLSGENEAGAIEQDLRTTPGRIYHLLFSLAGNPECNEFEPEVKEMSVSWDGVQVARLQFDTSGRDNQHMGWRRKGFFVRASEATTTLRFDSHSEAYCGPMIDAVSVKAES